MPQAPVNSSTPVRHQTDRGRIYEARAEDVYPLIEPGSVQLVISDGPYAMKKAEWDSMNVEDLPGWYRPHIAAWGACCAPAASVYVCGTDASASVLRPEMKAAGWLHRIRITWDKGVAALAGRIDTEAARAWPDVTEVYDLYQREAASPFPDTLTRRRELCGLGRRDLAALFPSRTGGVTGCVLNWERGYNVPTRDQWVAMMHRIAERGVVNMPIDSAAEHGRLRAEYEESRPPFTLPPGVTNVWSDPPVAGPERLKGRNGRALHSCQKPLKHIRRMVAASSRPGAIVLEPFGGSLRAAVAIESLSPAEARRYVCVEVNDDKVKGEPVDYLGPAIEELEAARGQCHLFR